MAVSNDLTVSTIRLPFEDSFTELMYAEAYSILPEIEKNTILLQQSLFGKE